MIVTHGWPGSVIEQLKIIGPLTDPTAHGGSAEDAFDVVIPSLPGYGFSGKPTGAGWDPDRIARAWAELMQRLGYTRYVAQGGDWGSPISSAMARQAPAGLLGIHINLPATVPPEAAAALGGGSRAGRTLRRGKRGARRALAFGEEGNSAYFTMLTARPQTVGYAATDLPAGLAAWILVHPGFAQWMSGVDSAKSPTKDDVLDNITLYWLTNTAASSGRLYWENGARGSVIVAASQKTADIVTAGLHHRVPGRCLSSPGELGAESLSQPDLLPCGRQRRALRRLGATSAVFGGSPRRLPLAPLNSESIGPSNRRRRRSSIPFEEDCMRRIAYVFVAVATLSGLAATWAAPLENSSSEASPIYGVTIPPDYRDWKLISIAHEEGALNDLRAQLGNDIAVKAYRDGTLPFPDGAIIAAIYWQYSSSEENNKVFGRPQSFVAGPPKNIQFMVKDSKKYAATGGWGFADFTMESPPTKPHMRPASRATCRPKRVTLSSAAMRRELGVDGAGRAAASLSRRRWR